MRLLRCIGSTIAIILTTSYIVARIITIIDEKKNPFDTSREMKDGIY